MYDKCDCGRLKPEFASVCPTCFHSARARDIADAVQLRRDAAAATSNPNTLRLTEYDRKFLKSLLVSV